MISKTFLAIVGVCGSLLAVAVPTAARAAEPAAQHASAWDTKVVCHSVKKGGSQTRERECATREQWRAAQNAELLCHWGKKPGAQNKEQLCETVAEWRARDRAASHSGGSPGGSQGTSPSVPGNSNFGGTAANQSAFQR